MSGIDSSVGALGGAPLPCSGLPPPDADPGRPSERMLAAWRYGRGAMRCAPGLAVRFLSRVLGYSLDCKTFSFICTYVCSSRT